MEKSTIKRKLGVCFMALAMMVAMIPGWSVTANAASDYGLVVGGEKVTSDNIKGTGWSYDSNTNTLILTNYKKSCVGTGSGTDNGIIYASSKLQKLKIVLVGDNELVNTGSDTNTNNGTNMWYCGIFVTGDLVIEGNGSLIAKGGLGSRQSTGIRAANLTVESGTITAVGRSAKSSNGIEVENLIVNGGVINASADNSGRSDGFSSFGVFCKKTFTMNDGQVTATAKGAASNTFSYGLSVNGPITYNKGMLVAEGDKKALHSSTQQYPDGYNGTDKTFRTYEAVKSDMYTVSEANNNVWYNSDVIVTAKSDYTISKTANGTFGNSISFTDETENGSGVFYIKGSDGTIYKGSITYKLDKTKPTISGAEANKIYCISRQISVNDSHLAEVKDVKDGGQEQVLSSSNGMYTLSSGTHTITAIDLAGNSTSITVTVNEAHTPTADDNDCSTAVKCSVCGNDAIPAKSHNFSGTLLSDQSGHWYQCQNKKCTQTSAKQAHTSSGPATETKAETCTVCGYTINAPLDHEHARNLQPVDAVAATCTTDGHKAYYKCSCGKLFSDAAAQNETSESAMSIPATGHSYGTPVYTWSEDNLTCTAVRTCEKCNAQESETGKAVTTVTPKDGCKTPEITLYTVTFSNVVFGAPTKEVVTKEADAHTPSEWIVDKEATTAEAGSRHKECTECGTILKTETIAKLTVSNGNTNPSGKNDAYKNAGEQSASNVPGTGDTSLVDLWALLMAVAVLGGVFALCRQRKVR